MKYCDFREAGSYCPPPPILLCQTYIYQNSKVYTWNEKELLGLLEALGIISASKIFFFFFFSFGKLKLWCPMYLLEG